MDGILPVDKPVGITSFDVIRQVKKLLPRGIIIGHAGTLDPFAGGVLLLLLGKATKQFAGIQGWKKTYKAKTRLGAKSDTLDKTGEIQEQRIERKIKLESGEVKKVTKRFLGEIEQVVPAYAADKYQGRKLYEYAREGKIIPEKTKIVTVYSIEVLGLTDDEAEMRVMCSSGTYIRQLSSDVFQTLGIDSYLENLTREAVGKIGQKDCAQLNELVDVDTVRRRLLPVPGES